MRFLVAEAENFTFCIPAGDPHLVRLKLKRNGGPTLLNGHRGGDCKAVHLDPGRYTLDIYHDSRDFPAGANLIGASFPMQGTILSKTNFSTANLACASFWSAGVTRADFEIFVLRRDFSCYLDLEDATIDFANLSTADWRFFDLTGSSMKYLPDILSTVDAPLDLSGVLLTSVR